MPEPLNIIITAGPTLEDVDHVMKITNMSTGRLACTIAETLLGAKKYSKRINRIFSLPHKMTYVPHLIDESQDYKLVMVPITDAQSLKDRLHELLTDPSMHIHAVVHNAAVGDYKAKYNVRGEDLANEVAKKLLNAAHGANPVYPDKDAMSKLILDILDDPDCKVDSNGKISSYEPHLMTMLTLTSKVINTIKEASPDTLLIGSKLLDGVTEPHLFDVAGTLRENTNADAILANDLSRIHNGQHPALLVVRDEQHPETHCSSIAARFGTKMEIAVGLSDFIFDYWDNKFAERYAQAPGTDDPDFLQEAGEQAL